MGSPEPDPGRQAGQWRRSVRAGVQLLAAAALRCLYCQILYVNTICSLPLPGALTTSRPATWPEWVSKHSGDAPLSALTVQKASGSAVKRATQLALSLGP